MTTTKSSRLRDRNLAVLSCLNSETWTPMQQIVQRTKLDRFAVKRTLDRLARRGLVVGERLETVEPWANGKSGVRVVRWWEWRLATPAETAEAKGKRLAAEILKKYSALGVENIRRIVLSEIESRKGGS